MVFGFLEFFFVFRVCFFVGDGVFYVCERFRLIIGFLGCGIEIELGEKKGGIFWEMWGD